MGRVHLTPQINGIFHKVTYKKVRIVHCTVADPEGGSGVRLSPLPAPVCKYPMKMK